MLKRIKYTIWALALAALAAGCSTEQSYTPAPQEDPDNYGVYFPTQSSPTEVEIDPSDKTEVSYTVKRKKFVDAITVPVKVTTSHEGIFEIEPITFGPGQEQTEFTVSFPKAEEGVTYSCEILVDDPHYISIYGPHATGLSFSVVRAGWELVTSADGTKTKGKWRDEVISCLYSMSTSTFNPYPEVEIEIYQRKDIKGYYRMKVYGEQLVNALVGSTISYQSRNVNTIVDARDPNKVFIPYQSTGLTLVNSDGEMRMASDVSENFMMDESVGQYGTLKDGVITFPAQSILLEMENNAGKYYYGNRNGMLRILLPGIEIPDYTVALTKKESNEGVVEIGATLASDVKQLKYSIFEGVLESGQASLAAQEMDQANSFASHIDASGTIKVENMSTGKYTLVGGIYGADNSMHDFASISFGYIAKDDQKPIILTMGLEGTNEYAGQGINTGNSVKFYAYGSEIESVTYGLFRTKRLGSFDADAVLNQQGTKMTAEQLELLNNGHFSRLFTGLNGKSDYTMLLRASNGYVTKTMRADYQTEGKYNPAMETFEYADFLSDQPSMSYLQSTEWNYYAINLTDKEPARRLIGKVTMKENTTQSTSSRPILDVKGLSGINFESGGDIFGFYIPGVEMFNGYQGAVALFTDESLTRGTYDGQDTFMGFVPEEATSNIYFGYGLFMGAVDDGYLYCVPSPPAVEQGVTFRWFFTGTSSGLFSLMYEMMLVDPAKDQGALSSAALQRVAELRRQALGIFTPRNFVELPEFNGSTPATKSPVVNMPLNLIVDAMESSAPAPKRVKATTTSLNRTATQSVEIRNVGVEAVRK